MLAFIHHRSATSPKTVDDLRAALSWVRRHGVERAVLATEPELARWLVAEAAVSSSLPAIDPCVPPAAPLDVAGALIAACASLPEEPILIVDASAPLGFDLGAMLAEHASSPVVLTIALVHPEVGVASDPRADIDRSGRILGLLSPLAADAEAPAVDGCLIVERSVLDHFATATRPFDLWHDLVPGVIGAGGLIGGYLVEPATSPAG
ncbi:MAG: hypothetical protein AB7I19_16755 [Planctomycetota bacterium]